MISKSLRDSTKGMSSRKTAEGEPDSISSSLDSDGLYDEDRSNKTTKTPEALPQAQQRHLSARKFKVKSKPGPMQAPREKEKSCSKPFTILCGLLLFLILCGLGYTIFHLQNQNSKLEDTKDEEIDELQQKLSELETSLEEKAEELKDSVDLSEKKDETIKQIESAMRDLNVKNDRLEKSLKDSVDETRGNQETLESLEASTRAMVLFIAYLQTSLDVAQNELNMKNLEVQIEHNGLHTIISYWKEIDGFLVVRRFKFTLDSQLCVQEHGELESYWYQASGSMRRSEGNPQVLLGSSGKNMFTNPQVDQQKIMWQAFIWSPSRIMNIKKMTKSEDMNSVINLVKEELEDFEEF